MARHNIAGAALHAGKIHALIPGYGANKVLPIDVFDFFKAVEGRKIDFLKLDSEGGEYDLVCDPRFADLDARFLVMEWHLTE